MFVTSLEDFLITLSRLVSCAAQISKTLSWLRWTQAVPLFFKIHVNTLYYSPMCACRLSLRFMGNVLCISSAPCLSVPLVTCSFSCLNIFLNTFCSKFFFLVWNQISHPCIKTDKILLPYNFIFKCSERRWENKGFQTGWQKEFYIFIVVICKDLIFFHLFINILALWHCWRMYYICLHCGFILNSGDKTWHYHALYLDFYAFISVSVSILVASGTENRMCFCLWYVCTKWTNIISIDHRAYGPGRPVRFAAHRQPLCWNSCTIHELFCL